MADIFNRTITLGPTFSGDLLRLTFGTNQGGLIVEQVQIQQDRQLDANVDIGTGNLVTILGVPRPYQLTIVGLIATAADYKQFVQSYGAGCSSAPDLTLTVTAPVCGTAQTVTYTFKNPRIVQFGTTISKQQYVYISNITLSGPAIEIA